MDKLTRALLDSKVNSLKGKAKDCKEDKDGTSAALEMLCVWERDINAEKEKMKRRHIEKEKEREKIRNKYRDKYGLRKDEEKPTQKVRRSYILDPKGQALEIDYNSSTLMNDNGTKSFGSPRTEQYRVKRYSAVEMSTRPSEVDQRRFSQSSLHSMASSTTSSLISSPHTHGNENESRRTSVSENRPRRTSKDETNSWFSENGFIGQFLSPLFGRRSKSYPQANLSRKASHTDLTETRSLKDESTNQPASPKSPIKNPNINGQTSERPHFISDIKPVFKSSRSCKSMPPLHRTSSLSSIQSSSTVLSDPSPLFPRDQNEVFDAPSGCNRVSLRDQDRESKTQFKRFLKGLRKNKEHLRCVDVAAQGPVHGDHSLFHGDNHQNESHRLKTADSLTHESSLGKTDGSVEEATLSHPKATSLPGNGRAPLCSSQAANKAEQMYVKYMSGKGCNQSRRHPRHK